MASLRIVTISTKTAEGEAPVEIELPPPRAGFTSLFAWSLNKAGSTLLTRLLDDYFAGISYPRINIPGLLFQHGLSSDIGPAEYAKLLYAEGYAYVGWRNGAALKVQDFRFRDANHALLVRDPRDRLVSAYFSVAHSHAIPQAGALSAAMGADRERASALSGADEWLRSNPKEFHRFLGVLDVFHRQLPPRKTRIYRYEDIIYRKREFLRDIAAYAGAPINDGLVNCVADLHDKRPIAERPNEHVRQVKFGNYKKHLSRETLAAVEEKYRAYLSAYDYGDESDFGKALVFAREGQEARSVLNQKLLPED